MAASITPLGTALHDCCHAHNQDPRLRTLRTVGGYASTLCLSCSGYCDGSARKQHHNRAFDFDSKALKYEEDNGNLKVLAIDLYRKCIEELHKGIAIDFTQGKGPSWGQAHRLTEFIAVLFVFRGVRSARHEERHYGTLSTTSGGPDATAASKGDPDANLLLRQKQHYKWAFDFDYKALKYDEDNDKLKVLAIDLYRKGIEELQKGLAIDFSQGKGPSWERAHMLIDKMKVNLVMAKDRIDFFEGMVKIENLGDDSRCHVRVARPEAE
ncbi:hypothetical protein MRX96_044142 [Rhipicephalus microplus]